MMTPGTDAGRGVERRTVLALGGVAVVAALGACSAPVGPTATTPGDTPETRASGLDTPWSMVLRRNGGVLVSERDTARIMELHPDGTLSVLAHLPQVVTGGEGGLLGLEILDEPNGDEWLYAYVGTETDNRVVRFALGASGVGPARDIITGLPRAAIHNGGRIKLGPDSLLYIGTGDATDQAAAQDVSRLNGKILRIDPNGGIPASNPFAGSPVYSSGHRNVQGLAWDSSGRLWASELGPEKNDELNLIEPGANHGWPLVTGVAHDERFADPIHVWPNTADASPSALAIAGDLAYVACLRGERLWVLPLPGSGFPTDGRLPGARQLLAGTEGRLRDVLVVEDRLWVATNEGPGSRIISLPI